MSFRSASRAVVGACAPLLFASAANAQVFTPHSGMIVHGGHEVTGNALLRCPTGSGCANNTTELVPVDVDPLAMGDLDGNGTDDTTMSASGTLTLPANAKVVSAQLYYSSNGSVTSADWTGAAWVPTTAANAPLLFGRTGTKYTSIVPQHLVSLENGLIFQGRYDVTSLVTGSGEYWVANGVIAPATHKYNRDALFVLVVIYDDGTATRFVQSWDGIYHCGGTTETFPLSGFRTPAAGAIDARFTIWGQDGHPANTGETATLGTTPLSNSANPANNIGNGTMTTATGAAVLRNPSTKPHQEPPELDTFNASAAFTNNQTSTSFTLACGATDGLFWLGATLSVAVVAPEITVTKTAGDVNGDSLVSGDEIRYEIVVENKGGDSAIDVVARDAIPEHTTFVPGSIEIEKAGAFVPATDAKGDDDAEIDGDQIVVRLGANAGATKGGEVVIGTSAKVRFRVKVDALTAPVAVVNRAEAIVRAAAGGPTGPTLTTPSDDGGGNGATTLQAAPCAASTAAIAPGCTSAAPVCLVDTDGARCVQCIDDAQCTSGVTCVANACSGSPPPIPQPDAAAPIDAGGAAPEVPLPEADDGCGCRATGATTSSAVFTGGLFAAIAAISRMRRRVRRDR